MRTDFIFCGGVALAVMVFFGGAALEPHGPAAHWPSSGEAVQTPAQSDE
jgi:hypothetical protein